MTALSTAAPPSSPAPPRASASRSRASPRPGMNVVMADVQQDALDGAAAEIDRARRAGAAVPARRRDRPPRSRRSAPRRGRRFGAPHLVFNNAGVGAGGLIWEHTLKDWEWVVGVNLMGVAHGVRVFTPMMLEAARRDPAYEGHIVNTASMAGLVNSAEHGRLQRHQARASSRMSETLYQDLRLVTEQIGARAVPVLRADRHRAKRAQPARGRCATTSRPTPQPVDRPGDERQGGRQRQGHRGAGRAVRVRCGRGRALLHLQPPEGAGAACRRGSRTSCWRATRPIRLPRSPRSARRCARRCGRPSEAGNVAPQGRARRGGRLVSPSARPPEAGLVPLGERRRINAFRLLGKRPAERRPACKPAARLPYSAGEGHW